MLKGAKKPKKFVTRFAPSPTGLLHIGHAYSALLAYSQAQVNGGDFLLRIEDIDQVRCRPEFVDAIFEDLTWLGLKWREPVRVQSEHFADYRNALQTLKDRGVAYPCFCTRKDIQKEISRAPSAPHGPDGVIYPGTCRTITETQATARIEAGHTHAWRLNLSAALAITGDNLIWNDEIRGEIDAAPNLLGDIILARKDTPTSYHLSVVCDDALQHITHVIRGEDLFHATHIHVVLQHLLGLPTPLYHHHKLLTDSDGKRFAKRNKAKTLAQIRADGVDAETLVRSITEGTGK
jgi:glutamyl-Q tRNA(Asp) synthetase